MICGLRIICIFEIPIIIDFCVPLYARFENFFYYHVNECKCTYNVTPYIEANEQIKNLISLSARMD